MDQDRIIDIVFHVFPWIIPAGFLMLSWSIYRRHRRWVDAPKTQVEAEVIGVEQNSHHDSDRIDYTPIYRFRTSLGQTVEARDIASSWTSPAIGSKRMVFYDRDDPSQVATQEGGVPGWGWGILAVMNAIAIGMAWFFTSMVPPLAG